MKNQLPRVTVTRGRIGKNRSKLDSKGIGRGEETGLMELPSRKDWVESSSKLLGRGEGGRRGEGEKVSGVTRGRGFTPRQEHGLEETKQKTHRRGGGGFVKKKGLGEVAGLTLKEAIQ